MGRGGWFLSRSRGIFALLRPDLPLSLVMRWFPSPPCLLSFAPALLIQEWEERGYIAGQNQ